MWRKIKSPHTEIPLASSENLVDLDKRLPEKLLALLPWVVQG
jgi:hypothetical protein